MMSARMISSNIYSSSGDLIKTRHLTAVINTPTPTDTKTHIANFTFGSRLTTVDILTRVDFPGGYFDAKGGVHWMLTDAIGSVEMVVDSGYFDPTGKDAMFTVEGNNITGTANIFIHGDLATKELAKQYQDDIYAKWGSVKEYEHDGTTYNVIWDVRVKVMDKNGTKVRNGINNYMKVTENEKSKVGNSWSGFIRSKSKSECFDLSEDNPMSHEFGHMLGLSDKYETYIADNGKKYHRPISAEWIGDIMTEPTFEPVIISNGTLNLLFNNVLKVHNGAANFNNYIGTIRLFPIVSTTIKLRNNKNRESLKLRK